MTTLWLAGAENPSHHALFRAERVDRVAVNLSNLRRHYWDSFTGLDLDPEVDVEWVAWADTGSTLDDLVEVIDRVGSLPTYVVGPEEWASHLQYLPVWSGETEFPVQQMHDGLVITDRVFKIDNLFKRVLAGRKSTTTLGVITGRPHGLDRFDLVIATSWWNASAKGETQVWDGTSLKRYNARDKDEKRVEHAPHIKALGCDPQAVLKDDPTAVNELAVRSWLALADSLASVETDLSAPPQQSVVDTSRLTPAVVSGDPSPVPATRPPRQRQVLPVMEVVLHEPKDAEGNPTGPSRELVASVGESIRSCNNCYLAPACPAFNPGDPCNYGIPIDIGTKEQLAKVQTAMIEIQTQRVFQSRFAEEILGQELSPETGREMDRLFKMVESMNKAHAPTSGMRVLIEGSGPAAQALAGAGDGGILSRLFGPSVGDAARQKVEVIDQPEGDVEDAEVVQNA